MPDSPKVKSGHDLAVLTGIKGDVERKGTVVQVGVPVSTVLAELALRGRPNDRKHRAKVVVGACRGPA
jgi:hypothetical protein